MILTTALSLARITGTLNTDRSASEPSRPLRNRNAVGVNRNATPATRAVRTPGRRL